MLAKNTGYLSLRVDNHSLAGRVRSQECNLDSSEALVPALDNLAKSGPLRNSWVGLGPGTAFWICPVLSVLTIICGPCWLLWGSSGREETWHRALVLGFQPPLGRGAQMGKLR